MTQEEFSFEEEETMPEHVSATGLNSLFSCSQKFFYEKIKYKRDKEFLSDIVSISKVSHDAVDEANKTNNPNLLIDKSLLTLRAQEAWHACMDGGGNKYIKGDSLGTGIRMVLEFCEFIYRNRMHEGITEFEIKKKLGDVPLYGFVDRIMTDDDGSYLALYDWKSKTRQPTELAPEYRLQMAYYAVALRDKFPAEMPITISVVYYFPDKSGKIGIQTFVEELSQNYLNWFENRLKIGWHIIENELYSPNPFHKYCSAKFCDFHDKCPGVNPNAKL